jgi:hypothetical protein
MVPGTPRMTTGFCGSGASRGCEAPDTVGDALWVTGRRVSRAATEGSTVELKDVWSNKEGDVCGALTLIFMSALPRWAPTVHRIRDG